MNKGERYFGGKNDVLFCQEGMGVYPEAVHGWM